MKTAVVYRSKTGFARKYAEWIARDLGADLLEGVKVTVDSLLPYETIIYGGGLYASGIDGVKLILGNLDKLKGKNLVVYATGACPGRPEELDEIIRHNFKPEHLKVVKFFYLRGGYDHAKLPLVWQIVMLMLKAKIRLKKALGLKMLPDEHGMLNAYDKPVDFAREKNAAELIAYVRSL